MGFKAVEKLALGNKVRKNEMNIKIEKDEKEEGEKNLQIAENGSLLIGKIPEIGARKDFFPKPIHRWYIQITLNLFF